MRLIIRKSRISATHIHCIFYAEYNCHVCICLAVLLRKISIKETVSINAVHKKKHNFERIKEKWYIRVFYCPLHDFNGFIFELCTFYYYAFIIQTTWQNCAHHKNKKKKKTLKTMSHNHLQYLNSFVKGEMLFVRVRVRMCVYMFFLFISSTTMLLTNFSVVAGAHSIIYDMVASTNRIYISWAYL